MQDADFETACKFPCEILAMTIEMEHRAENTDYEECIKTAMKVLSDKIETHKVFTNEMLGAEAETLQMKLMYGDPMMKAMFEGESNEM